MASYLVKKAVGPVDISAEWDSPVWKNAVTQKLEYVFDRSSEHHPDTEIRMVYDDKGIYGLFQVKDQYVRAVQQADQGSVCTDSCVEFFVHPAGDERYFNFEMNCGGVLLLYHVRDCRSGDYDVIPQEDLDSVKRFHTLPKIVDPEIQEPVVWRLGFAIPLSFFEKYSGINPKLSGQVWHANFTKCADKTSHPHWLSWLKLSRLDFHLPEEFGELVFE
ncbi:MAG: carbohydrate-binding family 9-like protein [Lentisphaeria bacterium]|nr:carbohydrate-binding family 9-like protein [Lentisphaeria bacterium]